MVLGQVSDAVPYRIDGSLDDQARVWDVRMTLAALDIGALPQPETVFWHTGSGGVSLPQPVVGRTYRQVLTQGRNGRWIVQDVVTPELLDAYRAGLRAR
jgi:hypothetical protein